ncbi:1-deoxy-D-xylulose-5-phosphate synthase [Candidatus Woesearchaeota archaeon]|nr:1-deoxy-D-xylulose-5-phosphate synthase [Candidatus Woesearchaeota archaeon]
MIIEKINNVDDLKKLKISELSILSSEIREFLVNSVCNTGGHLASSLGVVELTVVMHYLFNSPKDKFIWDVGHQAYAHKILTGRKDRFNSLRMKGGISGFPKTSECKHDQFDVGHASTSLSIGAGFAKARDLKGEKHEVICVIGDGALTGGMAFEGLNNIGYLQTKVIIVLNDNKMSISNNVGALSKYTGRITKTKIYRQVRYTINNLLKSVKPAYKSELLELKDNLKRAASPNFLFEKLGIEYIGPVNGHNIPQIIRSFKEAKKAKGPILIHLKTKKGKGFSHAENDSTRFHGIGLFDKTNGKSKKKEGISYSSVFGDTLCKIAASNKKVVAVTAAMCEGTGLSEFRRKYPNRFFDVGIAEQHAVTFAAAMAKEGLIPFVAIYSTFLQRSYDQLIHDVALQNLPVILAIDRSGLVGEDGPTHHGAFDISYLRHIPNMCIASPRNQDELRNLLWSAIKYKCPVAIRYPKGMEPEKTPRKKYIEKGSSELLVRGKKAVVIAVGSMVKPARNAVNRYNDSHLVPVGLINARFIKPVDKKIINYIKRIGKAIIVEENSCKGGFASSILEEMSDSKVKIKTLGIPDRFIEHGSRSTLLDEIGLSEKKIFDVIRRI